MRVETALLPKLRILRGWMTDAPVSITEPGLEKLPRKSDQKTLISRPRASVASRKVGQADQRPPSTETFDLVAAGNLMGTDLEIIPGKRQSETNCFHNFAGKFWGNFVKFVEDNSNLKRSVKYCCSFLV